LITGSGLLQACDSAFHAAAELEHGGATGHPKRPSCDKRSLAKQCVIAAKQMLLALASTA